MPALIASYSPAAQTAKYSPEIAHVRNITNSYGQSVSSIVFSFSYEVGLNQRIFKLLDEYAQLTDNWDGDDGLSPAQPAIKQANFLTRVLEKRGQSVFHAAPGPNGEIMLDIRNTKSTRSLEIIFYADRAVAVLFPAEGKPTQDTFNIEKLPQILQWLNQK